MCNRCCFRIYVEEYEYSADELKKPKRNRHPEMEEVNDGDELLVFKGLEDPDDK